MASDAYASTLIGEKPANVRYLKLAHERGIGSMFWEQLPHVEV